MKFEHFINDEDREKMKEFSRISMAKLKKKNPQYYKNRKVNPKRVEVCKSTNSRFKKESQCGICGSKENLQFHHWRYRMPVQRQDFSTLCRTCHKLMHIKLTQFNRRILIGEDKNGT